MTLFLRSFQEVERTWLLLGGWEMGDSIHWLSLGATCTAAEGLEGKRGRPMVAHSVGVPFSGIFIFGTARKLVD